MPVWFVRPRLIARTVLLAAAVVGTGCQGTATQTSPIFITDVISGTVVTGVPDYHIIKTSQLSSVSLGLSDLVPNTGIAVGIGLGSPPADGSVGCSVQVFQTVHVGESFPVSGVPAGTFCVAVFEFLNNGVGGIPDPLAYTVKVNHH